jgi:ATP phosphoribosyltransferase
MITLAIARGRLLGEEVNLLKKAGYPVDNILKDSRKLIFEYPSLKLKILIIRPTDIPPYVEYGAADCGIVGMDTLMEEKHYLYEPLDLAIGKCKLVVAAPKGFEYSSAGSLRIATKYPRIAHEHFSGKGVGAEIVKLYGSDVIVDLTATGETLKKNNLIEFETIAEISARLVVNRVSMKVKSEEIKELIRKLKEVRGS